MLADTGAFEMLDYIISLREGIMDAWSGIILALKQGKGWSTKSPDPSRFPDDTQPRS